MYAEDILCGLSKAPFEIPHKISDPYIERCGFYSVEKIDELLDLRAQRRFSNGPQAVKVIDYPGSSGDYICKWVQVFSLILDSSVGLSASIQSAGELVSGAPGSNPAFSRGTQLVSFRFEYRLPVPEHRN